ncbi:MAG: hypothetical protein ACE5F1_10520 [Planctomycetota bacterium]
MTGLEWLVRPLIGLSLLTSLASSQGGAGSRAKAPLGSKSRPAKKVEQAQSHKLFASYNLHTSRRLYAACDLDSDDRIDYFEARETLGDVRGQKSFRMLDRNNDGGVQFDEFDLRYKNLTLGGGQLNVLAKALERLPLIPLLPRVLDTELLRFFSMLDKNSNDRIELIEWKELGFGKDPRASFLEYDRNLSDDLTAEELRPILPLLSLSKSRGTNEQHLRPMPRAAAAADLNDDSLLTLGELTRAMYRIHPSLARHAGRLLRGADRNGDGYLDGHELGKAMRHTFSKQATRRQR